MSAPDIVVEVLNGDCIAARSVSQRGRLWLATALPVSPVYDDAGRLFIVEELNPPVDFVVWRVVRERTLH